MDIRNYSRKIAPPIFFSGEKDQHSRSRGRGEDNKERETCNKKTIVCVKLNRRIKKGSHWNWEGIGLEEKGRRKGI